MNNTQLKSNTEHAEDPQMSGDSKISSNTPVTYPENAIRVLDKGFVRLVDVMGDDASVVQAARVSYGQGTKSISQDEGLIRYLMRHKHTTPFEMVEFKFHCRMPIFVARQWIRHRTASVNEVSGRYSEMPDWFYVPSQDLCTTQSAQNKQGGTGEQIDGACAAAESFRSTQSEIYEQYQQYISVNMRRELARINLPLSMYTEWYWKIDLHNLLHFLALRLDDHAQYEIRVFAEAMAEIVKQYVPLTWKAFADYRLGGMALSGQEVELIKQLLSGQKIDIDSTMPTKREAVEFRGKLTELGVNSPDVE